MARRDTNLLWIVDLFAIAGFFAFLLVVDYVRGGSWHVAADLVGALVFGILNALGFRALRALRGKRGPARG